MIFVILNICLLDIVSILEGEINFWSLGTEWHGYWKEWRWHKFSNEATPNWQRFWIHFVLGLSDFVFERLTQCSQILLTRTLWGPGLNKEKATEQETNTTGQSVITRFHCIKITALFDVKKAFFNETVEKRWGVFWRMNGSYTLLNRNLLFNSKSALTTAIRGRSR